MSTHLKRTWVPSRFVEDHLQALGHDGEAPESEKRPNLTTREVFDALLYARGNEAMPKPTEPQFVTFCSIVRRVLRGVPSDTRLGGPQHVLWNRALAMYGTIRPKVCTLSCCIQSNHIIRVALQATGYLRARKQARRGIASEADDDQFPTLLNILDTCTLSAHSTPKPGNTAKPAKVLKPAKPAKVLIVVFAVGRCHRNEEKVEGHNDGSCCTCSCSCNCSCGSFSCKKGRDTYGKKAATPTRGAHGARDSPAKWS